MLFIARRLYPSWSTLYFQLAQASAPDFGVRSPRKSKNMGCRWLLEKMQAVTPEAQWNLVSRVEPLFHSVWENSSSATEMIDCARFLFPPRKENPFVINDDVRLAVCDILEFRFRSVDGVSFFIQTARDFAEHKTSLEELDKAHAQAMTSAVRLDVRLNYVPTASSNYDRLSIEALAMRAVSAVLDPRGSTLYSVIYSATNPRTSLSVSSMDALNAEIVRKSLGTPGLALLMSQPSLQSWLLPKT